MYLAVLLPSIFALWALYKNKLTLGGIISAWLMGIIITYCGGIYAFLALLVTFILTIVSDKFKKKDIDERRNIYQIFSNVFTSTLCTVLYYFTSKEIFIVMYFAVIGGSLADTLASGMGSLSKGINRNPLTFKEMKKGESGAISMLGLSASLLAGLLIGLIYYLEYNNIYYYLIIIIMSFLSSYFDSIMGAYLQGKYKCNKCRKLVEEKYHCNKQTKLIKGYKFFDNNVVNLLSNVLVFIITYIILK